LLITGVAKAASAPAWSVDLEIEPQVAQRVADGVDAVHDKPFDVATVLSTLERLTS
jgi:hypothetical protein